MCDVVCAAWSVRGTHTVCDVCVGGQVVWGRTDGVHAMLYVLCGGAKCACSMCALMCVAVVLVCMCV